MASKYRKIDIAHLNGEKYSVEIKEFQKENGEVKIPIICSFYYDDSLGLQSTNYLILSPFKVPRILDFKDEIKIASAWTKTDVGLCSLELKDEYVSILIRAWNEINPKWPIRRASFVNKA
jgi:hypothetical protein